MADKHTKRGSRLSSTKSLTPVTPKYAKAWINGPTGLNWMLKMDGWHISYNPATSKLGSMWAGESEQETAISAGGSFYILNGDYRKQYEQLVDKGLEACIAFFLKNIKHKSTWSNMPHPQLSQRLIEQPKSQDKGTQASSEPPSKENK